MSARRYRTSVVIITKDRVRDLAECIGSIVAQTSRPDEVIIVDAGESPGIEQKIGKLLGGVSIRLKYFKERPDTCAQRNRGFKKATGDVVFFFDDDTVLEEEYIENVLQVYDEEDADAVQGVFENRWTPGLLRRIFDRFFMLDAQTTGQTRVLPSGNFIVNNNPERLTQTIVFSGCCMSYKRKVLEEFSFDEKMGGGYSFKEDADFSYRVSRKYRLWVTPHAKLVHNVSSVGRISVRQLKRTIVRNNHYLFRKNFNQNLFQRMCFLWSTLGYLILALIAALRQRRQDHLLGALEGIRDIIQFQCKI